ncbi:MAG: ATP-binding protein, partial [Clostridia bacterium]|nr:ATP-binding protein [Clostridia bacterium]
MSRINVLPKNIAELIAAGEVVERPASVVKELVENSIDAGATTITVEIKNGGITYIRITDNGHGIFHEDVPKAFLSHATSKLTTADDLNEIFTLGFRGEALASVAAVSKVEILTKSPDESFGTSYSVAGGEELYYEQAGCPDGTTIVVRDIFFNTPARMKFLKRDVSEANAVADIVDKLAISHPEIS